MIARLNEGLSSTDSVCYDVRCEDGRILQGGCGAYILWGIHPLTRIIFSSACNGRLCFLGVLGRNPYLLEVEAELKKCLFQLVVLR